MVAMPTAQERLAINEIVQKAEAKRKELLAANKAAASLLLLSISSSTFSPSSTSNKQ